MQNITVRNASLADAPRILEIYTWYVEHTVITFEYDVPSLEEFEGRMRRTMQKYPYLVIEKDGRIEGYAYAGPFVGRAAYDWACELTIYLDHNAQKCGMGRTLYEALASRLQAMGILNLYACIGHPQVEDEYLTKTAPSSTRTWALRCAAPFAIAGISSAAGTTWSGWKRSSESTRPTNPQCSPIHTEPDTNSPRLTQNRGLFA